MRTVQYIPRNIHTVFALLCFVVVIHWLIFPYPSGLLHWHCKATLMNMDKYFMWIHYEWLHNHNKAKHNKTVCIFLGIYCMSKSRTGRTMDWTYCSHELECILTTNPDRPVLITIITWLRWFHPVNARMLHLNYEYGARGVSRFACNSCCCVTWCPLTTEMSPQNAHQGAKSASSATEITKLWVFKCGTREIIKYFHYQE